MQPTIGTDRKTVGRLILLSPADVELNSITSSLEHRNRSGGLLDTH
jgi:hypothetical protein